VNWESILIPAIPGVLALIGVAYGVYAKRRSDKDNNDSTKQARREPTWNEVVNENRTLRSEVDTLRDQFGNFKEEFARYRTDTSRKIEALVSMNKDAANQWPQTHEGPYFSPDDLEILEDTEVPVQWRGRIRPIYGTA
jgi:hypothetical protein